MAVKAEIVWFPVSWDPKRDRSLKKAAAEVIDWLDANKVYYEWLGQGRVIGGKFKVAINFPDSNDAVLPKLYFAG